jgi:5-methylthioadenosine/S-adenosylhomocysteine deaminase
MERCTGAADELEPFYRQMYLKTLQQPVPMNRWIGNALDELGTA